MKIAITGTSTGIGAELAQQLSIDHEVTAYKRNHLDLSDCEQVSATEMSACDMLINCAGTGIGGKIDFINHDPSHVIEILKVNLIAPVLLSQKILKVNPQCRIVNITSTNNRRYYPRDLAYSLSKKALADFGDMLRVEYPDVNLLEVRMGLTRTAFNDNRYRPCPERQVNIYELPHLTVLNAVSRIMPALFDNKIHFIEIAP